MLSGTHEWWALLRTVAAFNLLAWLAVALWLRQAGVAWSPELRRHRRWLLLLAGAYVLGCGWRSLLPVYDVQRLVLVDSFWSSVLVGRTVATVAELCFAAQWALLMRELARVCDSVAGRWIARAVLPMILTAEVFSWYAVLSTSNIGHVVEASLWGLCVVLLLLGMLLSWPRVAAAQRPLLAAGGVAGVVYVGYMFGVDVPMYWERWLADPAAGRGEMSLLQGLADVSTRWVVSYDWAHWRSEVVWMTAYFSVAVWLSIALVLLPAFRRSAAAHRLAPRITPPSAPSSAASPGVSSTAHHRRRSPAR